MAAAERQRAGAPQPSPHLRRIAARLSGLGGVTRLPDEPTDAAQSQSEQAHSLASLLAGGPLPPQRIVALAQHLAHTLAGMHGRGVLHLNITPAHILLHDEERTPLLIGFQLATTFAEERPGFTHHSEIRGNLAYLAPEQTGRTGRSVDLRADLYSLGVVLYEAVTGRLPFEAQDPLQLLHDHLVRLPLAPARVRPGAPASLSALILRLLEKEPERRYQSAEGLAHDLARIEAALARGDTGSFELGERDFAMVLAAPSRLIGRSAEVGQLQQALDDAVRSEGRVVLVSGAPGVGKTSLVNELRAMVTARRGWFVSGKFDQYRQDAPTATVQALRALGRLLLAEPEAELALHRTRILQALGANAGIIATLPEFGVLLGEQPEVPPAADAAQAEARLVSTSIDLLRAIASPDRPLAMVLDDLQWAGGISVRFIDAVLDATDLAGLLLVGSFRDSDVDAAHPVGAALARWQIPMRLRPPPLRLHLQNLPEDDMCEMLREMLRMTHSQAAALAQPVSEHTGGNPYDTVELLNALRREGALRPGAGTWEWDLGPLRRYVGHRGVLDLLSARVERLPQAGQRLMRVMACLGGQVRRTLLCAAAGLAAAELDEQVAPALEDGLLVIEPGRDSALRMRHDRVQQAVYGGLSADERSLLHLEIARRLDATPAYASAAVEQYVPASEAITDAQECRRVARLLGDTASRVKRAANYAVAERLLGAALALLARMPQRPSEVEAECAALEIEHHGVLCSLGRLEEADAVYGRITARCAPVEDWAEAAAAQVVSLHNRSRLAEAVELGLAHLRALGLKVPDFDTADLEGELRDECARLRRFELGKDDRPYTGDAKATAVAKLINRLAYPVYFHRIRASAWVMIEGLRLWMAHGPSPDLVHSLAHIAGATIALNRDFRAAYDGQRHVLGVSLSRGWEPATSEARFLVAAHSRPWFEPLEESVRELHLAHDGLQRNGQLHAASFTFRSTTTAMFDCAPTLRAWRQELDASLALSLRVHNEYVVALMTSDAQLLRGLAGDDAVDAPSQEALACLQRQSQQAPMRLSIHFREAMLAAIFGDVPRLVEEAAAGMAFVQSTTNYRGAQLRMLHALGLAQRLRDAQGAAHAALLAELDEAIAWTAQRAADGPANFLHVLKWLLAERAWAIGEFRPAAASFDEALAHLDTVTRPCQHALVAERCGLFFLEQGMARSGRELLAQSRDLYAGWGAAQKVRQLEAAHPFLAASPAQRSVEARSAVPDASVDKLDTLAILRVSQALSSETSVARLRSRVADLMRALTGATSVQLVLWDDKRKDWFVSVDPGGADARRVALGTAAASAVLPLSAFRYAERTREPLLVEDAVHDDRFMRDPYLAGLAACSLLLVPVMSKGERRAMLVLENRLSRGAFTTARLDAVTLIAGQLSVSVENALLYDSLELRVREQTRELVATARRAGMAQVATNVLHNVGNVLNSVNVSARVAISRMKQTRAARVADVAKLLGEPGSGLARLLADDEQGRVVPGYLSELAQHLSAEREDVVDELERLVTSVEHIKNVVAMQLSYAGASGVLESFAITELVDDALRLQETVLARHRIVVTRNFAEVEPASLDRTRLLQIFVNLIENAAQAMSGVDGERSLHVSVAQDAGELSIAIADNGCGITAENLGRIFAHGFTTRTDGHGFGLHSCAVAAREMGGHLAAHSDGAGRGASFTLTLPAGSADA